MGGLHPQGEQMTDEAEAERQREEEAEEAGAAAQLHEAARDAGVELPSRHQLLSFYDRLRGRFLGGVEKHGGKLPEEAAKVLLLVPDVFILVVRLILDKEVPRKTRAVLAGSLAFFMLPDLLPKALFGPIGYLDDLVVAVAVLSQLFAGDLEPYARKHWNGPKDLRAVMQDVGDTAHALLGQNLYDRLRRLLARRGIHLRDGASSGAHKLSGSPAGAQELPAAPESGAAAMAEGQPAASEGGAAAATEIGPTAAGVGDLPAAPAGGLPTASESAKPPATGG
jgi:uncharacterized membrane protein YkvA (DUF1232 family)